jgi:hypothetical protein
LVYQQKTPPLTGEYHQPSGLIKTLLKCDSN